MKPRLHALASLLAALYLCAGFAKVLMPYSFLYALNQYDLPSGVPRPTAIIYPWIEIYAGAALLHQGWRISGASILFLCGLVTAGLLIKELMLGREISCGCFGPLLIKIGWLHVVLNIFLCVGTIYLVHMRLRERKQEIALAG